MPSFRSGLAFVRMNPPLSLVEGFLRPNKQNPQAPDAGPSDGAEFAQLGGGELEFVERARVLGSRKCAEPISAEISTETQSFLRQRR
jgi:hypothetical protein